MLYCPALCRHSTDFLITLSDHVVQYITKEEQYSEPWKRSRTKLCRMRILSVRLSLITGWQSHPLAPPFLSDSNHLITPQFFSDAETIYERLAISDHGKLATDGATFDFLSSVPCLKWINCFKDSDGCFFIYCQQTIIFQSLWIYPSHRDNMLIIYCPVINQYSKSATRKVYLILQDPWLIQTEKERSIYPVAPESLLSR